MNTAEPSWLPLLRRLTTVVPAWNVWKNADSALAGEGDVDSVAPRSAWPVIVDEFREWAQAAQLGPVIVCRHAPGTLVVVACAGSPPARLLELDVYERAAGLAPAESLRAATEIDERGFRRLRPGTEGLLRLLLVARRGGRPPRRAEDLEPVRRLLTEDPHGAQLAGHVIGSLGPPALAGARAVLAGSWSRRAMLMLELSYAGRAIRDPRQRVAWLRFKLARRERCPVLRALAAGRVVPGDLASWLEEVAVSHPVHDPQ